MSCQVKCRPDDGCEPILESKEIEKLMQALREQGILEDEDKHSTFCVQATRLLLGGKKSGRMPVMHGKLKEVVVCSEYCCSKKALQSAMDGEYYQKTTTL